MDLYRVLRISIYLLAASGAFADSVAEENAAYLIGVVAFGALAYFTVDARRWKPVRFEFAGAMALALLVYTLLPLREESGWDHFPAALAHFLCAVQVLLFFTPFRGPQLLLYCAATLGVVVLSGVIKSDITLVGRLICFVTIVSWTLFVHALWRAREAFNARSGAGAESRNTERVLSERMFWQELAMTGGMSAICLLFGVMLYLFAPRVNDRLLGYLKYLWPNSYAESPEDPKVEGPAPPVVAPWIPTTTTSTVVGPGTQVWMNGMAPPLRKDASPALQVKFTPLLKELATPEGRLLLKQAALSKYEGGWFSPRLGPAPKEPTKSIADPSATGPRFKGAEYKVTIVNNYLLSAIREYMVAGTLLRVGATAVDMDEEGTVSAQAGDLLEHAEIWAAAPPRISDVPDNATAVHDKLDRYVFNRQLPAQSEQELTKLARGVTAGARTDKQKVLAIVAHLRDSKRYEYTLRLDQLRAVRDDEAICRFLLDERPSERRGHCVYFASAFVLLCRLNNIPARLVRGFSADFPTAAADGSATVTFLSSDSHAWGEVYFAGVGWVAFDPTPHTGATSPDPVVTPLGPVASGGGMTHQASNGAFDDAWKWFISMSSGQQRDMYDWIKGEVGGATTVLGGSSVFGWAGALIAWALVAVLLGAMVYAFLRRGGRRLSLSGGGVRRTRAAVAFYNDLLSVLSRRGYVRRPGQTPREFAELVVKRGGAEFQPVLTVTEIFESIRYGDVDVSQDDYNALQKSLDRLKELTFGVR